MSRRILAITQTIDDPATRYRVGLYRSLAVAAGVEIVIEPWPREEPARRSVVQGAAEFDAVVVQRRLLPTAHAKRLRRSAKWLAFDFDDAVMYRDSARGRPWVQLDKLWQFRALVSSCDAVTAGNSYLAELAAKHVAGNKVRIVPTVVDLARYAPVNEARERSVLGWIGHRSTLPYLQRLAEPLGELTRRHPQLQLRCIADVAPNMPGVHVKHLQWTEATEADELARLDVGLAPLPDDSWTRGKCGLRLLQYLAAGVPSVTSPVGAQGEIASTGAAMIAASPDEWISTVESILANERLRTELIERGRRLVNERFRPQVWIDTVLAAWGGKP